MSVNKKSVFYKILISYILVSTIPLLVMGSIFYNLNISNLQREVMNSYLTKLTQVKDQIDFNMMQLKDVALHISNNPNIFPDIPGNSAESASDIIPELQTYVDNSPVLKDIMLYRRGDVYIYLPDRQYLYFQFERQIKNNYNWTQANFFRYLNTVSFPTFKQIDSNEGFDENDRLLVGMFPVPPLASSYKGTVAFVMKEATLEGIFENYLGSLNGYVCIFDQQYNILVSNSKGVPSENMDKVGNELRFSKGTGVFKSKLSGQYFTVMRIVSKDTGWSYAVAIPEVRFFERVNDMRNTILLTIAILLLGGLFLAMVISVKHYEPVRLLFSHIVNYEPQHMGERNKNEFDLIRSTYDKTFIRNRELSVQVDVQRPLVKDQCLLKILRGKMRDTGELDYLLNCSNIQLKGALYFVLFLSIPNTQQSSDNLEKAFKLVEELYFQDVRSYGIELPQDKGIAIIASLEEESVNIKEIQLSMAKHIESLLDERLQFKPVIGIGNAYKDILQMNTSFLQASAAIHNNFFKRETNIHFFCDINCSMEQVYWYPITEQALLIQSLKQGDRAVALSTLNTMVEKIAEGTRSYLMVRCVCFDIINNIIKTINQMNLDSFDSEIKRIAEFNTLADFKANLNEFTVKFCNYIEKSKETRTNELKYNVINFVKDNFKDGNISLEGIAERFGVTTTNLSRFFKDEIGYNFIEYISNLRMDEVRNQLRMSDKPIKDIIREVGYIDAASFIRKFKSLEGITPGQYRETTYQKSIQNNSHTVKTPHI